MRTRLVHPCGMRENGEQLPNFPPKKYFSVPLELPPFSDPIISQLEYPLLADIPHGMEATGGSNRKSWEIRGKKNRNLGEV